MINPNISTFAYQALTAKHGSSSWVTWRALPSRYRGLQCKSNSTSAVPWSCSTTNYDTLHIFGKLLTFAVKGNRRHKTLHLGSGPSSLVEGYSISTHYIVPASLVTGRRITTIRRVATWYMFRVSVSTEVAAKSSCTFLIRKLAFTA